MNPYVVVKEFSDNTYTTEFFRDKERAKEYADVMRKNKLIARVTIYEATEE